MPSPQARAIRPLAAVPEIVVLPDEIDIASAASAAAALEAVTRPGAVIIADMTRTVFCDCAAARALRAASDKATACQAELRLALPSAAVLRILQLLGLDRLLRVYPSLSAALTASPLPRT